MKNKHIQTLMYLTGLLCILGCAFYGLTNAENPLVGLIYGTLIGMFILAVLSGFGNMLVSIEEKNEIAADTNMLLSKINENLSEINKSINSKNN
ncbi:MAG: hypothetical protein II820_04965 [Ruminiclostridium sp.]|nr:hypothetical protein [Ruminiclostridium sp.]